MQLPGIMTRRNFVTSHPRRVDKLSRNSRIKSWECFMLWPVWRLQDDRWGSTWFRLFKRSQRGQVISSWMTQTENPLVSGSSCLMASVISVPRINFTEEVHIQSVESCMNAKDVVSEFVNLWHVHYLLIIFTGIAVGFWKTGKRWSG